VIILFRYYSKYVVKLFSVFILIVSCTQIKQVKSKPEYSDVDFNSFSLIELTSIKEGPFVKPKFSLNNSAVFFLSYDLSSLYYEKLASDQVINIYSSEEKITEYLPIGSSDSAFVVERNYSPKSQIKSSLIFVKEGKVIKIEKSSEVISNLSLTSKNNLVFFEGSRIKFYDAKSDKINNRTEDDYEAVFINSTNILFYAKNKTDKINLTNHQNVSWVSKISNDSLLIYSGEDKLILLSLNLKDIVKIGDYTSPVYNKLYKKIAVLNTKDNGMKELSSDILLLDLNGLKISNLTKSPAKIESNIQWSHDGKKLAFDESGQIKLISFGQRNPITK